MFADPTSIAIGGVATNVPRVSLGPNSAAYRLSDGSKTLTISHAYGKRVRRVARLDDKKLATDVYQPSLNSFSSMSAYLVVDEPLVGYTLAQQQDVMLGLMGWLNTNYVRFNAGES